MSLFHTFEFGEGDVATKLNNSLKVNQLFLYDRPCFRAMHSANQTVTSGSYSELSFDDTSSDYCYMRNVTRISGSRFAVDVEGIWRFSWSLMVTPTPPGSYYVDICTVSGPVVKHRHRMWMPNVYGAASGTTEFKLPTNGQVMLKLKNEDSASVTVERTDFSTPIFSGHWIREGSLV